MKPRFARGPLALTLRRCLELATPAVLAVALAALGLGHWLRGAVADRAAATGAATPWLNLPLFAAALACALGTVVFWPRFAAHRPGADWAIRLQRGPLGGCGAAIAGALLAQLVLTIPLTTLFAFALGAPPTARAHCALAAPREPLLAPGAPRLAFAGPATGSFTELHLRPLAAMPTEAFRSSHVQAFADGTRLQDTDLEWDQTGQFRRVVFAPRRIAHLELVLVDGTVPLFFPTGSVELVEAADRSGLGNGVLAAGVGLVPSFLALAIACLCGATAALPTVAMVVIGVLFVMTIGGLGPFDAAIQHTLRGRWLPSTDVFRQCVPSLLLGCLAMISAMLLRRRLGR